MAVDEFNPFESPKCVETTNLDFYSDQESLFVRPHCRLPARCIFTNKPIRPSAVRLRIIPWQGNSFQLITNNYAYWGVASEIQRTNLTSSLLNTLIILAIVLFFMIGYSIAGMITGFAIGAASTILLQVASKKLTRHRVHAIGRANGYFRVVGCGREFLNSLPDESGIVQEDLL